MKWLKFFRERNNISMQKLSDLMQVKLNTIWRWENDKASPSVEMAKKLAEIFHITETELLNGPQKNEWELKLVINKKGDKNMNTSVINLTGETSAATLELSDNAMGITLSAGYDLWEDEEKFEALIEQIRKKRNIGLKTRREDW